ncbi:hypothetical protein MIND_01274900 [Mycena indigotica]|uniref:Uncharacterized protein n=1 Tax=Mycena indigotica TaxID=2126181 RepID=A0A8H6S2U7_9AGAR|nr:uncharacterized protein MIND_01274900 [Mycena indigotica]KAF7291308.1 hypothetical protein MIND_01274900 [Mycena indigotica]
MQPPIDDADDPPPFQAPTALPMPPEMESTGNELSTSASTIRTLPPRSPLQSRPTLPPTLPHSAAPPPSPTPSSASGTSSSSLLSLEGEYDSGMELDSVSSSFFFSSAAASPPQAHHHGHDHATELVIPSLTLPGAAASRMLVMGADSVEQVLPEGWRVEDEECDPDCRRVWLTKEEEGMELVFVNTATTSTLISFILDPFRALVRVLTLPENDLQAEENKLLLLDLLASEGSPTYAALLVVPGYELAVEEAIRRLVPVVVLQSKQMNVDPTMTVTVLSPAATELFVFDPLENIPEEPEPLTAVPQPPHFNLPTPPQLLTLKTQAAALFLDWWAAARRPSSRYHRHLPQLPPPSRSSSASRPRRAKRKDTAGSDSHTPFGYTHAPVSLADPLHLPSLARLVRDVVAARLGFPELGTVSGMLLGLGVGVVLGAWLAGGYTRVGG